MIAGSQSSPVPSPSRVDAICEKDGRENSSAKQTATASLNAFMFLCLRMLAGESLEMKSGSGTPVTAAQECFT
jgi:hypothetical protein